MSFVFQTLQLCGSPECSEQRDCAGQTERGKTARGSGYKTAGILTE